jgi:perosamine synthetase
MRKLYSKQQLDITLDRSRCPENDRLCSEAIWLTQTMLLGPRKDMDDVADAVRKVQAHAAQLVKERTI